MDVTMNYANQGMRSQIVTDKSSLSIEVLHPFPNFTLYCVLYKEDRIRQERTFEENI